MLKHYSYSHEAHQFIIIVSGFLQGETIQEGVRTPREKTSKLEFLQKSVLIDKLMSQIKEENIDGVKVEESIPSEEPQYAVALK